jgi:hypothetical protein
VPDVESIPPRGLEIFAALDRPLKVRPASRLQADPSVDDAERLRQITRNERLDCLHERCIVRTPQTMLPISTGSADEDGGRPRRRLTEPAVRQDAVDLRPAVPAG